MRRFGVIVLLVIFVAFMASSLLPAEVTVQRSVVIKQPAATVYTLLNGFHYWHQWSPWHQRDPDAQYLFEGSRKGVGARLSWTGDPALLGQGWQEIVLSKPHERIDLIMDIGSQGEATSRFDIIGDSLGSQLTWTFNTDLVRDQGFFRARINRFFGLFLKRWVAEDFEKGLLDFKNFAETLPDQDFSTAEIGQLTVSPLTVLRVAGEVGAEPEAMSAALAEGFRLISAWTSEQGITPSGAPMAITKELDAGGYRFAAAIPVEPPVPAPSAPIDLSQSPSGEAVRIVHRGNYGNTLVSYERALAWMAANGLRDRGIFWEHYVTDPAVTPNGEMVIHIYFLLEDQG